MPPQRFQQLLLSWFAEHGRHDLPWQQAINPYRVWLSEIMLQQTQVASVIPYFNRFVARFPNLQTLAAADLDEVLPYWSGLGYYARARNLHKTAQILAAAGGAFPQDIAQLTALPGIGLSTAGAILSIACGQSQPILDGNVKRVLTRFHAIPGWPGDTKVAQQLWQISRDYTPLANTAAYTQAMMDLGATLCSRSRPQCIVCPVATGCQALATATVTAYPQAKPRKQLPVKSVYFLLLQDGEQQLLLKKRPPNGIWGGLWSLPEFSELAELQAWCLQCHMMADFQILPQLRHSFSHYHLHFTPVRARLINPVNNVMEADQLVWYNIGELSGLGLPTPVKRLLDQIIAEVENDTNGSLLEIGN